MVAPQAPLVPNGGVEGATESYTALQVLLDINYAQSITKSQETQTSGQIVYEFRSVHLS